jgi:hypothetical protein
MRFSQFRWFAALLSLIGGLLVLASSAPTRVAVAERPRFDEPGAAAWHDLRRRQPADGGDMPTLYDAAARQVEGLARFASRINRTLPFAQPEARVWMSGSRIVPLLNRGATNGPTAILDAWTPLGPGNIGGRTRVVRFHPATPTTLFAAGVSGGIWRSDDDGASWHPTGDGMTNINVNALAIDPRQPDVMYAGTGEGYFREEIRGTGLPLRGAGIFVTRNGGVTWTQLAATNSPDFQWVNDLELGVNDPARIYASTRTGVWRSTDSGATWSQLLKVDVRGGCMDLALRPDRAEDVLFASCGSYEQATVYRFARAAERSDAEAVLSLEHMGRTSIAIAPSNPDIMYALSASNDGGPGGNYRQGLHAVYRSASGGDAGSWEVRTTNRDPIKLNTLLLTNSYGATQGDCSPALRNDFTNMGWYINVIAVDPRDPNRVWAAGVDWFRSDDGGRNWGMASWAVSGTPASVHADQHAITFHPSYDGAANQTVMIGGDGGVYRSNNARGSTATGPMAACTAGGSTVGVIWTKLNNGYGVTQFYHGTPFTDGVRYLGGTQDNGTVMGQDVNGPNAWRTIFGGDGGFSAIHPTTPSILYVEYQWAALRRSLDTGQFFAVIVNGLDPVRSSTLGPEANYLFVTPFVMDLDQPSRLWLGGEFLYRSSNGTTWQKASAAMPDGANVSAIAVRPGTSSHVVIGTNLGDILWTRTATASLNSGPIPFTPAVRPRDGWVTSVAFDPRAGDVVYATYGNFGGKHVFRSIDGGASWQDLDGSGAGALPDIPVHSIVVDPDDSQRLYLGTDLGVMITLDGGRTWLREETGFGPAVTMWLSIVRDPSGQKLLFAFTHGRGAWRVKLAS